MAPAPQVWISASRLRRAHHLHKDVRTVHVRLPVRLSVLTECKFVPMAIVDIVVLFMVVLLMFRTCARMVHASRILSYAKRVPLGPYVLMGHAL